jgi:hypothetical protein
MKNMETRVEADERKEPDVDHDERRQAIRYEPAQSMIVIGWSGPSGFESTDAGILNLSLGGVAVIASGVPAKVSDAWIRRAGTYRDPSVWVRVDVEEISSEPGAEQTIRLKFTEACPYELFKTVILAARAADGTPSGLRPSATPHSHARAASPSPAAERVSDFAMEVC